MFSPAAERVFETYEKRLAAERKLQQSLSRDEFSARLDEFLLPLGSMAARALHALAVARDAKVILELGTSYGYSTLFFADAAKKIGGRVITMDLDASKQAYAKERLEQAELADVVDWRCGDAVALIKDEPARFDFVLLDIWKDLYVPCLRAFHPKLAEGAIVAADNMIEPVTARGHAREYRAAVAALPDMTSALLPIGSGIEVSVKWPKGSQKL